MAGRNREPERRSAIAHGGSPLDFVETAIWGSDGLGKSTGRSRAARLTHLGQFHEQRTDGGGEQLGEADGNSGEHGKTANRPWMNFKR